MHRQIARIVFLVYLAGLTATAAIAQEGATPVVAEKTYFIMLKKAGPLLAAEPSAEAMSLVQQHFVRLQRLQAEGKVLLAGLCDDESFGMVLVRTHSEAFAREVMTEDPAVKGGAMTGELYPFNIALGGAAFSNDGKFQVQLPAEGKRVVTKDVIVAAPLAQVWRNWTTSQGMTEFLGVRANIDLRVGGPYELYFNETNPPGKQGSEGCRILSYIPQQMLSYEWNAPPDFGEYRDKHTCVVVEFAPVDEGHTQVVLTQHGWGDDETWDKIYAYFDRAWGSVLAALEKHHAKQ